jgi:hypothetical protein
MSSSQSIFPQQTKIVTKIVIIVIIKQSVNELLTLDLTERLMRDQRPGTEITKRPRDV